MEPDIIFNLSLAKLTEIDTTVSQNNQDFQAR